MERISDASEELKKTPIYMALQAVKRRGIQLVVNQGVTNYRTDPARVKACIGPRKGS